MKVTATRYHDISAGHRVYGHESKCAHLHGHNHRVFFTVEANELDSVGRVMDFSVIKSRFCEWLEEMWDHKFLVYEKDPWAKTLKKLDPEGVVLVPFNPTAENMGKYLMVQMNTLTDTGVTVTSITVEETRKCSATVTL